MDVEFNVEFDSFNTLKGDKGDPGYTPVKGVDYFTEEDKDELISDVKDQIHIPTKTGDLTNDSGFLTSHQDISGKADKVTNGTSGNLTSLDSNGNLVDSGSKTSDFASSTHNHDSKYVQL